METRISKEALLRRFSFLELWLENNYHGHVNNSGIANIVLEPVTADLGNESPEWYPVYRRPFDSEPVSYDQHCRLILLSADGESIGEVGKRNKIIPARKFLWWTIPEYTEKEEWGETVTQALERVSQPVHYVLKFQYWHHKMTLFIPPDGHTVDTYLPIKITEAKQAAEARHQEYERQAVLGKEVRQREEDAFLAKRLQDVTKSSS